MRVAEQIAALVGVNTGMFDQLPQEEVLEGEKKVREAVCDRLSEVCERIETGEKLSDEDINSIQEVVENVLSLN